VKKEPDIIQIENVFYSEPENPEKKLFVAVILQALLDLSKNIQTKTDRVNKDRAESWFFTSVGVTCKNFEEVCGMAGVTPSKARSFAYKVMNADDKKFLRKRIRSVLRGDDDKEKRFDI
tara:strand:+ start:925 stop:1281 length:357 start_codon:yes stop_codon:yes gene_type:complete